MEIFSTAISPFRGETDRIDAALLARYGLLLEPRLLQAAADALSDLKELHVDRLALVKERTAAKNRAKNLTQPLLMRQNASRLRQISVLKALRVLLLLQPLVRHAPAFGCICRRDHQLVFRHFKIPLEPLSDKVANER